MKKALFLDRDGTLIEHKPYLHKPEEVALLPGTTEALRRAQAAGYLLFLFTNQSGVGRGYFTLEDVRRVHARLVEVIGLGPNVFTEICVAPEHPDAPSRYRKPSPRFINEMIARYDLAPAHCWMIGDSPADWQAGVAAKIRVAAVKSNLTSAKVVAAADELAVPMLQDLSSFIATCLPPVTGA